MPTRYNSDRHSENQYFSRQYRWANPLPKSKAKIVPLWCNGKRCQSRNWKSDRESHRNLAFKWARATEQRLEQLDDDVQIMTGCLKMSHDADLDHWRKAKSTFCRKLNRWRQSHGWQFEFVAKQHISLRQNPDSLHYDLVVFHDIPRNAKWVRTTILDMWYQSGGVRGSSLTSLDSDITDATNYLFKFAEDGSQQLAKFLRTFPLPATRLPVTWCSGQFWGVQPMKVTDVFFWNDHLTKRDRLLSGLDQWWRRWLKRNEDSEPPRFITDDYRAEKYYASTAPIRG